MKVRITKQNFNGKMSALQLHFRGLIPDTGTIILNKVGRSLFSTKFLGNSINNELLQNKY